MAPLYVILPIIVIIHYHIHRLDTDDYISNLHSEYN